MIDVLAKRRYNARIGMILFLIYLALYAGFVLINAFAPAVMEWRPWGGLNLAILYGFGLIFAALLLAAIYGVMCRTEPDARTEADATGGQEQQR